MLSPNCPTSEHVTGLIERVTFHNPDSGFCVLRVEAAGRRERVTVVGTAADVRAGEWLDAEGHWTIDSMHGRQFRAAMLRTARPDTLEGMRKYLASGLIRGIGPEFASRLVKRFGADVFETIERRPERLVEVEGIGPQRRQRIVSAWRDQQAVRQIMVFLHSHGVGTSRAFRIYKTYGEGAIEAVRQDPYRLARDIRGIGFKTADQIARSLGIDPRSDLRARAGVEYVLQQLTEAGHCAFSRESLVRKAARMLEIPSETIEAAIEHGLAEQRLTGGFDAEGVSLIYLTGLDYAERALAEDLVGLAQGPGPWSAAEAAEEMVEFERAAQRTLSPRQHEAVRMAMKSKVMVITGGPGVGKTTLIDALVRIGAAQKLRMVLAAPTGRAAKRLSEATGMAGATIHRLLEFDPAIGTFRRDAQTPLEGDVFIIDEVSMLDVVLAHQLVRAIPRHAAVILVGDVDQLPSVGPGRVLRDIIESGVLPVVRLTEVFRQAASSAIVTAAHRINRGLSPELPDHRPDPLNLSDFYFLQVDDPQRILAISLHLICQSIPRRFGFHRLNDIQLITPMQRGPLGARALNVAMQQALNPAGASVTRYGWTFRIGDKVMQTVNNYDKDVFNGDIGRVVSIDEIEQEVHIEYDGRDVAYGFDELDELTLCYAMTVHKAQGSEYPAVVIPLHMQHYAMLQRNLLYTAVTRGRKLVVVVGSRKAMDLAVRRMELGRRITTLADRLRSQCLLAREEMAV